jgi:hypothetical protein
MADRHRGAGTEIETGTGTGTGIGTETGKIDLGTVGAPVVVTTTETDREDQAASVRKSGIAGASVRLLQRGMKKRLKFRMSLEEPR